ncbi:MAG: PAS domain-containing protein [Candidatus Bathyarchaeia archaeon]
MLGGSSKDDMIGKNLFKFIAKKDYEKALKDMERAQDVKNIQYTLLTKDGQECLGELSISLLRNASHKHIGYIIVARNVKEIKHLEKKLNFYLTYKTQINRILQNAPFAISVYDPDGTLSMANKAFLNMIEIPLPEIVIGKYNILRNFNIKRSGILEELEKVFSRKELFLNTEAIIPIIQLHKKSLTEKLALAKKRLVKEITAFPIYDESGEIYKVVIIWKDIFERKTNRRNI